MCSSRFWANVRSAHMRGGRGGRGGRVHVSKPHTASIRDKLQRDYNAMSSTRITIKITRYRRNDTNDDGIRIDVVERARLIDRQPSKILSIEFILTGAEMDFDSATSVCVRAPMTKFAMNEMKLHPLTRQREWNEVEEDDSTEEEKTTSPTRI